MRSKRQSSLPPISHGEQKAEQEAFKLFLAQALRRKSKGKKGPDPYKEQEN